MGRPNKALMISEADRPQLRSPVRSQSMPHSLVRRAQGGARRSCCCRIRASPIGEVARRRGVSAPVVSHWRRRYKAQGI
jgi:hypothetical protein